MKIAVASEGKMVTEHFGHCENFFLYEKSIEGLLIVNKANQLYLDSF